MSNQSRYSPYPDQKVPSPTMVYSQSAKPLLQRPGSAKITRPRPSLNRTLSFCSTISGEGYASATQSSPSPPPGRLSKPLSKLPSGEVIAPGMERTLSSPGIGIGIGNGISRLRVSKSHRDLFHEQEHKDREGEGAWYRSTKSNLVRYRASAENLKVGYSLPIIATKLIIQTQIKPLFEEPVPPVPKIIVDSPHQESVSSSLAPPSFRPPFRSTNTPGLERYSPCFSDAHSTPGIFTPNTPVMGTPFVRDSSKAKE
jgi:hypothetical protein